MKWLYKPLGLVFSVVGGLAAAQVFNQLWRLVPGQNDEAPDSTDPDSNWREILIAAALQGAVFGGVKALVDRAGARGFQRVTGVWPG